MSERKVASRRMFIALEIVCIILLACLVGATSLYSLQINDKDNTITSLQSQMNNLTNIVSLANSTVWVNNQTISQPQDSWSNWTFKADYAGYVSVQVYDSTILNPSAEVVYSYQGINYDQQKEGTTEAFPVMPTSIEIRVGNGPHVTIYPANGVPPVTETVTITYYY
jgi:hypothetical protein